MFTTEAHHAAIIDATNHIAALEANLQQRSHALDVPAELAIITDQNLSGAADAEAAARTYIKSLIEGAKRTGVSAVTHTVERSQEIPQVIAGRPSADGIVFTLPLNIRDASERQARTEFTLSQVPAHQDVDGLNPASGVKPATAEATFEIWRSTEKPDTPPKRRMLVCGGEGHVGRALVEIASEAGHAVASIDKQHSAHYKQVELSAAEVVFGATNQAEWLTMDSFGKGEWWKEPKTLINIGRAHNADGKLVGNFAPDLIDWVKTFGREFGWRITAGAPAVGRMAITTVMGRTIATAEHRQGVANR